MGSVAEIEQAIAKLPLGDFVQLERWFGTERNRKWDQQIQGDAQSGKLRELYERLQSENQGQSNFPLDEFLDNEANALPRERIGGTAIIVCVSH